MDVTQIKRQTLPCPRAHGVRAHGGLDASIAIAWDQAMAVPSGGSSRREARRAGRMHREEEGRRLSEAWGRMCPIIESVAVFPTGLTDGELGRPESPHGAEFKQGLELA